MKAIFDLGNMGELVADLSTASMVTWGGPEFLIAALIARCLGSERSLLDAKVDNKEDRILLMRLAEELKLFVADFEQKLEDEEADCV